MKDYLCVFTAILIWCAVMPMALRSGGQALAGTGAENADCASESGSGSCTSCEPDSESSGEAVGSARSPGRPPIYIRVGNCETGRTERHELELYVARALSELMGEGTPAEALKAQAVALRSVVCFRHEKPCHEGYELCTNGNHCFALPPEARTDCIAAAEQTEGLILTYKGGAALALSHDCSCARTESCAAVYGEAVPYLVSVSVSDESSPDCRKMKKSLSFDEYEKAFEDYNVRFDSAERAGKMKFTESGRVCTIEAGGLCFKGSTFARLFGLPSTCFTVEQSEDRVTLSCCGSGDGVGMSRLSAVLMAKVGADFRTILERFFPGTELSLICVE